jgi:hypothetical protein
MHFSNLLKASKKTEQNVVSQKPKNEYTCTCMFMYLFEERNYSIWVINTSYENITKLKYLKIVDKNTLTRKWIAD